MDLVEISGEVMESSEAMVEVTAAFGGKTVPPAETSRDLPEISGGLVEISGGLMEINCALVEMSSGLVETSGTLVEKAEALVEYLGIWWEYFVGWWNISLACYLIVRRGIVDNWIIMSTLQSGIEGDW